MSEPKITAGISIDKAILDKTDAFMAQANCASRSEFIANAIRFYIAFLQNDDDCAFFSKSIECIMNAKLQLMEDRIASLIFKLAVEESMLLHVIAKDAECTEEDLERLRGYCVTEVKKLNGKFGFKEAYHYQHGD